MINLINLTFGNEISYLLSVLIFLTLAINSIASLQPISGYCFCELQVENFTKYTTHYSDKSHFGITFVKEAHTKDDANVRTLPKNKDRNVSIHRAGKTVTGTLFHGFRLTVPV